MQHTTAVIISCAVYFAILIGIGIWAWKRNQKATDFLVAGRKIGLLLTTFTTAAVQIGAGVVLGGASGGAASGVWPGMWYSLGCGLGCICAGLFVAKKMREYEGVVPLDYYEGRFGYSKGMRFWAWLSNVPSLLGILVAQLLACGSILSAFGIPFSVAVVITALVILIWSSLGGMWAVVMGDLIHTIIMFIGIPLVAIILLVKVAATGIPISSIYATPFIPSGMLTKFIYLVTPFLVAISVSYDAFMRYQSAKDGKTAQMGLILGGFIIIILGTMASTIGAAGHILYPDIKSGVFANVVAQSTTPIVAGIVIAAALGAAMSAGNGLLIALGASFSRDFYNKLWHPDKSLDELPKAKAIAMWAVGLGCLVAIFFSFKLTSILDAIILFNYPYMGSMLVPLLAAVLYPNATRKGCFAAMGFGGVIGITCFLAGIPGPLNGWVNPDMGLFIAYIVSLIILVGVSQADKNKSPMLDSNQTLNK